MTENRGASGSGTAPSAAAERSGPAWLVNLVIALSFFPFFRYLPLGDIEVQPAAAIVAAFGVFVFGIIDSLPLRAVMAILIVIVGQAVFAVAGLGVAPAAVAQQAIAYAAPLPIILFLWGRLNLARWRVIAFCGGLYLVVGVIQLLGLVPGFVDNALSSLIARYQSGLEGGGRGVVMLAPEPDYASRQLVLFVAFAIYFYLGGRITRRTALAVIGVNVVAMVVLNRSITGILILSVFLAVGAVARLKFRTRGIAGGALAAAAVGAWQFIRNFDVSSVTEDSPRLVQLGANLLQAAARGGIEFKDIVQFASARIVTGLAGIRAIADQPWFGAGIGRSEQTVVAAIQNDPILASIDFPFAEFGNLKPQAWVTAFALETGIAGIVALVAFVLALLVQIRRFEAGGERRAFAIACIAAGLLQLALLGPHSLPEPWLLFAMISLRVPPLSDRGPQLA